MSEAIVEARGAAAARSVAFRVTVEIGTVMPDAALLVSAGVETPHERIGAVDIDGGVVAAELPAEGRGQTALLVWPTEDCISITYTVEPPLEAAYPEAAFLPRRNRYTAAADDLASAARRIARDAGGGRAVIAALVAETHSRFECDHPDRRFNDGHETVPYLSCGLTPGSCVDINIYLVAGLRAAGFEAAYVYGYFFPKERGGITNEMRCWVVTRHNGEILEWDIAHHIKAGLKSVAPTLNPRPGRRVAVGHSMGHRHRLPEGWLDLKLLAEPIWIKNGRAVAAEPLSVFLRQAPTQAGSTVCS